MLRIVGSAFFCENEEFVACLLVNRLMTNGSKLMAQKRSSPALLACKDVNDRLGGSLSERQRQGDSMNPALFSRYFFPRWSLTAVATASLMGCAQMPTGPTAHVMPGPNKPFEVFVADDKLCRDWAHSRIGGPGSDAAAQRFAAATATGVMLGAAAGAMIGGNHAGAGVGAALGGMTGAAVGSDQSQYTTNNAQRRYDIAYQQCMYAKGNQVPGTRVVGYRTAPAAVPPAPPRPPEGIQPPPPMP